MPCVLFGSMIFGLVHIPSGGIGAFVLTFLVGIVFATARFRGASIVSLAIVHSVIDFLNSSILSGELRFDLSTTLLIAVVTLPGLAILLMVMFKPNEYA